MPPLGVYRRRFRRPRHRVLVGGAIAAGTNIAASLSEGVSSGDALSPLASLRAAGSDGAAAGDGYARLAAYLLSAAAGARAGDVSGGQLAAVASITTAAAALLTAGVFLGAATGPAFAGDAASHSVHGWSKKVEARLNDALTYPAAG